MDGHYKAELDRGPELPGPWQLMEEPGLATLGWVLWQNNQRLDDLVGEVSAEIRHAHVLSANITRESVQDPGRLSAGKGLTGLNPENDD